MKLSKKPTILAILAIFLLSWVGFPGLTQAQAPAAAVVKSLQGRANEYVSGYKNIKQLTEGTEIAPFSIVTTGANSKLMLGWQEGLFSSLGESSSLSSSQKGDKGPVSEIQMIEGIGRFTTDTSVQAPATPYTVSTPMDSIRPEAADQPVDYIVEVDGPNNTILTVLSGKVHVVDRSNGESVEHVYGPCSSVYFSQGKQPQEGSVSANDVAKMVDITTVAGTLPTPETCPTATAEAAAPAVTEVARFTPDYYVDNSYIDFYPYDEIECYPYQGGYIAVLPYIGDWFIPYSYPISPAILQVFANDYLINQAIFINNTFITNINEREGQLRQAMDLAVRTGNIGLAAKAQNQLNVLQTQKAWAEHQLGGIKTRLKNLQTAGRRFGGQVPNGTNLTRTIANSFTLPRNADVAKKFQNRLTNQINLEQRMTGLAQNQIDSLKGKLAAVHDPSQRLALRNKLVSMNHNLMQGKIPVTAREKGVSQLARQLETTRTPEKRLALQDQLLNNVGKIAPAAGTAAMLNRGELSSLRNQISQISSPAVRRDLTNRVSSLEKAARTTKQQEAKLVSPQTLTQPRKQFEQGAAAFSQPQMMRRAAPQKFQPNRVPQTPVQPQLRYRAQQEHRLPSQVPHFTAPQTPRFEGGPQFRARQFERPQMTIPRSETPHAQSIPHFQSMPRVQSVPHFQSMPHVQSMPHLQSMPHVQSMPHLGGAPAFHGRGPHRG